MSTARRDPQPLALQIGYITARKQFSGDAKEQERRLLAKISECAAAGVDFVQLREKDLSPGSLEELAHKAIAIIPAGSPTRLLINSRIDVALACGAHGVHLPAGDLLASDARMVWNRAGKSVPIIGVSVHSPDETALAEAHGADFAVFGPVFEKDGRPNPQGLEHLRQACRRSDRIASMPLLAVGGVSLENARRCLEAGASGVTGIRLFQENDVGALVERLRKVAESADRLIR
jgi:thiamine-phosphate pyrophosphorylase